MFFRNLTVYRLAAGWSRTGAELESTLTEFPLQACIGLTLKTLGWVPVNDAGEFAYSQEKQVLICLGVEEKLLPGSVIKQEADARIRQLESDKGFKLGRKAKLEVKDQVAVELTPRAFSRRRQTLGWLDSENGWLVVDTSSPSRADEFTQALRNALGELPATPLQSDPSMSALMTMWLAAKEAPGEFDLDDECEVTGTDELKATVRYTRHALDGKDIAGHLSNGKVAKRLALTFKNRISFIVDDKVQIRRLKFLDIEKIKEEHDGLAAAEQFDADFALMSGEFRELLTAFSAAINAGGAP